MADSKGVLVFGEMVSAGGRAGITLELLGVGRKLADALGEELMALVMADGITQDYGQELIAYGADKVFIVNHPLLAHYTPDPYIAAAEQAVHHINPNIFIMGRTEIGQDVAPILAFRLDTGLAMDCLDLVIDPDTKLMQMIRPVYGGNAQAVYVCDKARPQMATARPKTQDPAERQEGRTGEFQLLNVNLDESMVKVKFIEEQMWAGAAISLPSADIVISGGRALTSPEEYEQYIVETARILGGASGASKAACDGGIAPPGNQVGLTGQRVSPKLYFAVGISGASQHLAGMGTSKTIVAINKDANANIFKVARYGVVGDFRKIMPAFMQTIKELVGKE